MNQVATALEIKQIKRYQQLKWVLTLVCLFIIGSSLIWNLISIEKHTNEIAKSEARAYFNKDQAFRLWGTKHGGVYVPVTEQTPASPYLQHIHDRDIEKPDGTKLTLMNPAYMVRQMQEEFEEYYGIPARITSLKPLNKNNEPDAWEASALHMFEQGTKEVFEFVKNDGVEYLRLFRPMITTDSCLKCHEQQGYKTGDIRGGVGVSIPMQPLRLIARQRRNIMLTVHLVFLLLGLTGIHFTAGYMTRRMDERITLKHNYLESESRFRITFDQAEDAIFLVQIMDDDGLVIRDANRVAADRHGYTRDQLIGETMSFFSDEGDLMRIPDRIKKVLPGKTLVFEKVHKRKDGSTFPVEVSIQKVEIDRKPYIYCIERDITERHKNEDERLALEKQIHHAQKLESLGVLAGGIAHDFNNLLMAIIGNTDLALLNISPVSPAKKNIESIATTAHRAAELSNQMLAYSGKGKFVVEDINLSEVVEEMTHLLDVSISKKAVLKYEFADQIPFVRGDATQLRQIIMNLITNASDAIGDRSGLISIRTGAMECDSAYFKTCHAHKELDAGLYCYIEVADTGCGMDEEAQQKIFDPFFTTKFTGRGLGMSAVLGIVRGHDGAIKLYTELGKGTTIKVLVPAVSIQNKVTDGDGERCNATQMFEGTVLLVDDEESIRAVTGDLLRAIGLQVVTAEDGREALAIVKEGHHEINCVIMDLTMPHMDGEQAFREMRQWNTELPILICSGYNEQHVTQRFIGKGLTGFIQKPFQLQTLIDKLSEVLKPV